MRIISGSAKGANATFPKNMRVRPTADRIKEALFNILQNMIEEMPAIKVLDVFAGTGNLGIEALSRGAAHAVFIDNHRQSAEMIKKNLQMLDFEARARIIVDEALAAIHLLEKQGDGFGLISLDPPYSKGYTEKILECLSTSPLVTDDTIVVARVSAQETISRHFWLILQNRPKGIWRYSPGLFQQR